MKNTASHLEFQFLDPASVKLFRGPLGTPRMKAEGHDRSFLKVKVVRAFPMTEPNTYIGFLDSEDKDIGVIEDMNALDPESKQIVLEELEKRYFLPRIARIRQLNHEFDLTYFETETDRGPRDFSVRGHSENVVEISPGRYIIEDVDGSRFEIVNLYTLDRRSQDLMAKIL